MQHHASESAATTALSVRHLVKEFPGPRRPDLRPRRRHVRAVADVSFDLAPGETLGLVGESGCGKSTSGRCLLRLIEPTSGQAGSRQDLLALEREPRCAACGGISSSCSRIPMRSLHPRMRVADNIAEPLRISDISRPRSDAAGRRAARTCPARSRAWQALSARALRRPAAAGGHRPRAGAQPEVIVLDEPVSALDVSVQAGVLNLLKDMQQIFGRPISSSHTISLSCAISRIASP